MTAHSDAAFAALKREHDAALAVMETENARLREELRERTTDLRRSIEYQAATIDVLKVMSSSSNDTQPVFDIILHHAMRLCDCVMGAVWEFDGTLAHIRATHGHAPDKLTSVVKQYPRAPTPVTLGERSILEARIIHLRDYLSEPGLSQEARDLGHKSVLAVPLLRDGAAIGSIALGSRHLDGFSDVHIGLLQTFAEQAVIAIGGTATFRSLQTRTSDLQESLEYQIATSDVLKVISRSTFDLDLVLRTVAETAARLCDADQAHTSRYENGLLRLVANVGFPPEYEAVVKARGAFTLEPTSPNVAARAVLERRPVHIADVAAVPGYGEAAIRLGKQRTSLGVPLLREGDAIGVITLARQRVDPFTERQIDLVRTFADQAVIAIENARLINEQREALEQQTATAEVLRVINASPGDLAPVFDALLEKALRLCGASIGGIYSYNGSQFEPSAFRGISSEFAAFDPRKPLTLYPGGILDTLLRTGRPVQDPDLMNTERYRNNNPYTRALVDLGGIRALLDVPLLRDGDVIGVVTIFRDLPGAFSDKQIALLENFAAQAVIAMENARLINEQREALEQQTATAEVLRVINASPGDLTPVFDAILEKAHQLCSADTGAMAIHNGQHLVTVATHGLPGHFAEALKRPSGVGTGSRFNDGRRFLHIPDIRAIDWPRDEWVMLGLIAYTNARARIVVPLRKDGVLLGIISANRSDSRPFSERDIALLENFAAQAVIAMENARLLGELRQRTEQLAERNSAFSERIDHQAATIEVLKEMSASPDNPQPVFDLICGQARALLETQVVALFEYDGTLVHHRAFDYAPDWSDATTQVAFNEAWPRAPDRGSLSCRAILDSSLIHVRDLTTEPGLSRLVQDIGHKTQVSVPIMRDGRAIGAITTASMRVDGITHTQIELLKTFAEQAVIAIGSAETYRALRARTTDLQESLEQQTATAEVLQVINASPGVLAPVFDAMLEKAMRLCGAAFGLLATYHDGRFQTVATRGVPAAYAEFRSTYQAPGRIAGGPMTRVIETKNRVHVLDMMTEEVYRTGVAPSRAVVDLGGARTILHVPLLKDDAVRGIFTIYRQEVRAFSDKEIDLLENFAAQAVIAMENARLLTEQREALEQQTATAEVLQVINASPGNLAPVFDAMLDSAMRLCGASIGTLYSFDGTLSHAIATRGLSPEHSELRRRNPISPPAGHPASAVLKTKRPVQVNDVTAEPFASTFPETRKLLAEVSNVRALLNVPLLKDGAAVGFIAIFRREPGVFSGKQIALLENFAAQAVIAMESARLLNELRARTDELAQRQNELRVTFENMGDGVAMFDESPRLVAWNRKFQEMLALPDGVLEERPAFPDYIRYLATRGEFGAGTDPDAEVRRVIERSGEHYVLERARPNGRVIEIRQNPVPGGGFVLIYADITERKRNEAEIAAARDAAQEATRAIEAAFRELKTAQANLVQAEKMASLGQLTAGIAHEIKNPLNFVNNFAILSVELLAELKEAIAKALTLLDEDQRAEIEEVSAMLTSNLEKITEHGKRADGIVRAMLEHSRGASGERRMVDLNTLADEALNLAYHGARAQDQSFNVTLERHFATGMAPIEVNPQDMTRVFLNLFSNGFYAASKRARDHAGIQPTITLTTNDLGDRVEIRVHDNGTGIPAAIRDKLFEPFFTTKPSGEGTGLGLSITYDIVTKQHGGSITVTSEVDEFTEFTVTLPRGMFASEGTVA